MIYGYARVSTVQQAVDGNSLESQEAALRNAGAQIIYADAFTTAFMIPNLLRRLFAENAISVAFIPTFKTYLAKGGTLTAEQQKLYNDVLAMKANHINNYEEDNELIDEFVHSYTTECNLTSDFLSFTELECSNRLFSLSCYRVLTSNNTEFLNCIF